MDALTHVFLPLTVAYAIRSELFDRPQYLALGGLGLLPDADKLLGYPGLLHSLTVLIPLCLGLLLVEHLWKARILLSGFAVAFIMSHLVLDVIDGGPVPLLYPMSKAGVGLVYPIQVTFGKGFLGLTFHGAPVTLHAGKPRSGFNTYGFINAFGVASMLSFLTVYIGGKLSSDS